jgi:hypothetical protein
VAFGRAWRNALRNLRELSIIIHSRQCLPNRIAGAEIEKAVQQVNAKRQEQKEQRLLETSFEVAEEKPRILAAYPLFSASETETA